MVNGEGVGCNGPWVEVSGGKGHDDGVVIALAGTRDRGGAESRFVSYSFFHEWVGTAPTEWLVFGHFPP